MKLSEGVLTSCMAICARYIISSCFLIQICRTHTSKKYMHKITEIIQAVPRPYRAVFHIGISLGKSRLEVSKKRNRKHGGNGNTFSVHLVRDANPKSERVSGD